jgi:hypothetical protein
LLPANILSYPVKTQGNFPKISIILARALGLLGATTEYRYREIPTNGLFGQEIEDERFVGEEQMSYVESNLVPGEVVIYQTRLHWIVMLGHVVLGCLLLGLSGVLFYYTLSQTGIESGKLHIMEGGGVALLVCGVVAILLGMVRRNATEMAVTNRRVVIKTGLASRKTIEMLLNKVESIEVSETAFGRMLGYGTIVVIGTGGTPEPFHKVAHPLEFRSQVQQQIEKLH